MKKRWLCICVGLLCLVLFCACGAAELHATETQIGFASGASVNVPNQQIEIVIDTTKLNRSYDGKPSEYPAYTSDLDSDPRVNYIWYEKTANGYVEIATPPTYVGEYKVTLKTVADGTSNYFGEASAEFSITPAIVTPLSTGAFPYNGASVFVVENVHGVAEDVIGYEIAFEHGNVGAALTYIKIFGDNAENYAMDSEFLPKITPRVLRVEDMQSLTLSKIYDATDLVTVYLDAASLPGFLDGEGSAVRLSTSLKNVCGATATDAFVAETLNPNYKIVGTLPVSLEITPAPLTLPATVNYCGKSEISVSLPTGLGADVLDVTLCFAGKDVGSALLENGVTFSGALAANYVLPAVPNVSIAPCVIDLSTLHDYSATKAFDGTKKISLQFTRAEFARIPEGETLVLNGTVDQIGLCNAKQVVFYVSEETNGNFIVKNTLSLMLSVQKATVKISGELLLAYNGMTQHPLSCDNSAVSGVSAAAPVALFLVFESAEPGARFLGVKIAGENARYYEADVTELVAAIRPVTLTLNASKVTFAVNGESTRVIRSDRGYLLTAVAQGDDVYVVLTFTSAQKGAELVSAELCGKDAHKYVLNIEDFTATLV